MLCACPLRVLQAAFGRAWVVVVTEPDMLRQVGRQDKVLAGTVSFGDGIVCTLSGAQR
jgi:hypothetical protein